MSVAGIISRRKSIRSYVPDAPVTDEQLRVLLEAAMLAPSACNMRPWEFIVVRDHVLLDKIQEVHNHTSMLATAQVAIIVVANFDIHNAISEKFIPQDCAAATQNILLQAAAEGLGTCWCGVYPDPRHIENFSELFGLSGSRVPFNVIAVGVPNEEQGARGFYEEEKVSWL